MVRDVYPAAANRRGRLTVIYGTSKIAGQAAASSPFLRRLSPRDHLVVSPAEPDDATGLRATTVFHGARALTLPLATDFFALREGWPSVIGRLNARQADALERIWRNTEQDRAEFGRLMRPRILRALQDRYGSRSP